MVDEIGSADEVRAVKSIAQRGVMLGWHGTWSFVEQSDWQSRIECFGGRSASSCYERHASKVRLCVCCVTATDTNLSFLLVV